MSHLTWNSRHNYQKNTCKNFEFEKILLGYPKVKKHSKNDKLHTTRMNGFSQT